MTVFSRLDKKAYVLFILKKDPFLIEWSLLPNARFSMMCAIHKIGDTMVSLLGNV